jgi:exonuclease VII large subunit
MNRRMLSIVAMALMLLSIPVAGYAQDGYYRQDQRDNGRDWRDHRRNRNHNRFVMESIRRIDRLSGQLKNDLDRSLDRSRFDGRNREDRINDLANDFHSAAAQLRDRFDDGRNPGRASQEARRMLELGSRLDRIISRQRFNRQVEARWWQIKSDLRVVQNAFSRNW